MNLHRSFAVDIPDVGLETVLAGLKNDHRVVESRNGRAYAFNGPTTITYTEPTQAVLFNPLRDANPFFHVMEFLWMLAGRNDVDFVANYAANMRSYSVDDRTFHAAYGHRISKHFGFDQLEASIEKLRVDPASRQAVVSLWSAEADLCDTPANAKDRACNLMMKFAVRRTEDSDAPRLHMTVFNRSNDIVFGTFGANLVHMSMFLMYAAARLDLPVGYYHQVSDDLHLYGPQVYGDRLWKFANDLAGVEPGSQSSPTHSTENDRKDRGSLPYYVQHPKNGLSLFTHARDAFLAKELAPTITAFLNQGTPVSAIRAVDRHTGDDYSFFLNDFVLTMAEAHQIFKRRDNDSEDEFERARSQATMFLSSARMQDESREGRYTDWYTAGIEWLQRRKHTARKGV